jgi:hypothetical protein
VGVVLAGKDALAALDYGGLVNGANCGRLVNGAPPTTEREWLGQSVIFWPVASESALVVGRTYDIVLAQALTGQHAHADRHGKRWLAGALVAFHGKRNSAVVDS